MAVGVFVPSLFVLILPAKAFGLPILFNVNLAEGYFASKASFPLSLFCALILLFYHDLL